jgi:hypothetical protein
MAGGQRELSEASRWYLSDALDPGCRFRHCLRREYGERRK